MSAQKYTRQTQCIQIYVEYILRTQMNKYILYIYIHICRNLFIPICIVFTSTSNFAQTQIETYMHVRYTCFLQVHSGRFRRTSVLPVQICAQNSMPHRAPCFVDLVASNAAGFDAFLYSHPRHSAWPSCAKNLGLTWFNRLSVLKWKKHHRYQTRI